MEVSMLSHSMGDRLRDGNEEAGLPDRKDRGDNDVYRIHRDPPDRYRYRTVHGV
jgi:hypothetical protein